MSADTEREQSDVDEAALMARIAQGDRDEALRELYRRYEGRLYGLGLRVLGDPSLAEELVQETFVRIWRSADRYDPDRGTVRAFVYTMARRLAIDLWRRQPKATVGLDQAAEPIAEDQVDRMLVGATIRDAVQSLSPAHREVIELAYDRGLTQTQIAKDLGLPLGTVKTRCFHALRALRTTLTGRGFDG